jgi:CheY-like chemotaxis protein/HPt (histidine-containing phosphotransfer) domain-containing protein
MVVLNTGAMASAGPKDRDSNQELIDQLALEFRDTAVDLLGGADDVLSAGRDAGTLSQEDRDSLYRVAHSLKGIAASCGYSLTGVVAHRFEDFLADLKNPTAAHIADMQKFVDTLGDLVDGTVNEKKVNVAEFVRKLPSRRSQDFGDVAAQDIEVFVVMPDDAVSRHVMRELQACGYRVTREGNSFKAIEIAAMMRPDLIIVTGVLDALSGVDLVSAFRAMPSTGDIPVALITADSKEEAVADGLPEFVPVIRKGTNFGDDLTDALSEVGIL